MKKLFHPINIDLEKDILKDNSTHDFKDKKQEKNSKTL